MCFSLEGFEKDVAGVRFGRSRCRLLYNLHRLTPKRNSNTPDCPLLLPFPSLLVAFCPPQVFQTYATRKGVDFNALRFLLDGERIPGDATPKTLELEDQDQIDCMLEQTGGR